jgi:LCP family protein required for cell wall assembly
MSVYDPTSLDQEDESPPRPGRRAMVRFLLGGAVILVATAAVVSTAILLQIKTAVDTFNTASKGNHIPNIARFLQGVPAGGPQTILVLGSDRRFSDIKAHNPVRSDTIILMRLDPSKGATGIMSIPRDLKVKIPYKKGLVTDKINAAYALGGPALAVKTVHLILHIPINHVVNVNFGGFRRAVNRLGCVYADVDRRYYNDNNPPAGGGPDYATIHVNAGYQKLCGQNALDYVRYRHFDTDLVRAARQQDFLRQAKEQFGVGRLFTDRNELLRIFGRYTQTDIHSTSAILSLLKLAFESSKHPIQEVHFRSTEGQSYVTATAAQIRKTVSEFLNAKASSGARAKAKPRPSDKHRHHQRSSANFPGLFAAAKAASDQAIRVGTRVGFPVYYPTLAAVASTYVTEKDTPRAYTIADRGHHRYRAYRLVVRAPGLGQYYGIEGTSWTAPPILDNPSTTIKMRGRKYGLFYDGSRLRLVAFRTPHAVYWVSNTLLETIKNKQMLGIARSLTRVG